MMKYTKGDCLCNKEILMTQRIRTFKRKQTLISKNYHFTYLYLMNPELLHQPAWQHGVLQYQVIFIHHVHIYLKLNFYSFLIFN